MRESPPPRFRIRLEDGSELPISSVDALARRVARGDVGPDTPLFDASTGSWLRSADASVVRFILDELSREGGELPPEWEGRSWAETPGAAVEEPAASDPLELGLTPVETPPEPTTEVDRPDGEEREPEPPRAAGSNERDRDWMTSPSEGGLFTPTSGLDSRSEEVPSEARGSTRAGARRRGGRWGEGTPSRRPRWIAVSIGVVVIAGAWVILGRGSDAAPGGGAPGGAAPPLPAASAAIAVPEGLDDAARRSAALIGARFREAADSLRLASGLDLAPPEAWLGGYYLANAGEFPEVRAYWEGYAQLVEDFGALDRRLFDDVVGNLEPSLVAPERRGELAGYLQERYESTLPARRELYAQLNSVATVAIDLHDFLVGSNEALRYTPAVGSSGVPRDPVLEVGTDDPAVRQGLDARLDALFDALDQSRGGGAPSQAGLEDDLFGRFGAF